MTSCGYSYLDSLHDPDKIKHYETTSKGGFINLHSHSHYSKDGYSNLHDLASYSKELGFPALALTDHGMMAGVIDLDNYSKQLGLKAIYGNEMYVESHGLFGTHLTVLALDQIGYYNLVKLNNLAYNIGSKSKSGNYSLPITYLLDKQYTDGIMILTGCPASLFNRLPYGEAYELARRFKSHYGGRFIAEIMFSSYDKELYVHERASQLAKDLNLLTVFTLDSHFARPEQAEAHREFKRMTGNADYESSLLYLATKQDVIDRVKAIDKAFLPQLEVAMYNSLVIADMIENITVTHEQVIPEIPNAKELLYQKTWKGFSTYQIQTPEIKQEVERQLEIISKLGFDSYHLILDDLLEFARNNNIAYGVRGSAAGSLVSYLIGITKTDPIPNGLLFDRFLNEHRAEFADVDVDISSTGREAILEYANRKYGAVNIANWNTWSPKSLIRKLGGHFGYSQTDLSKASDLFEDIDGNDDFDNIDIAINQEPIKTMFNEVPLMRQMFFDMLGNIATLSQHAGGIIIAPENIILPITKSHDRAVVVFDKKSLEKAGGVKFDILGLNTWDILQWLENTLHVKSEPLTVEYSLFETGDTLGLFQLKGRAINEIVDAVQPKNLLEVSDVLALCRPVILMANMHTRYIQYHKNKHIGYRIWETGLPSGKNYEIVFDNGVKVICDGNDVLWYNGEVKKITEWLT